MYSIKIPHGFTSPHACRHACPLPQAAFSLYGDRQTVEALIQHPMDRALRDAKIVRTKALIKPANALPLAICLIVETLQPKYDPGEEVDVGDATGTNRSEAVSYRHCRN